jgi:hypothetical protein
MTKIGKLIDALFNTDAHPTAKWATIMIAFFGALAFILIVLSAQPYRYKVQCAPPKSSESRITLVSRRTGIVITGPAPDASGVAAITSDNPFNNYDIKLDDSPCVETK